MGARQPQAGQQMGIDKTQPEPVQAVRADEMKDFSMGCHRYTGQVLEELQNSQSIPQRTERQLADDHRMDAHPGLLEQPDQRGLGPVEVVDPDGGVDEDHAGDR